VNLGYTSHIVSPSLPWAIKGGRGPLDRGCPFWSYEGIPILVGRSRGGKKLGGRRSYGDRIRPRSSVFLFSLSLLRRRLRGSGGRLRLWNACVLPAELHPTAHGVSASGACRAREAASVRGTPVCFKRSSVPLAASSSHMRVLTWVRGRFTFCRIIGGLIPTNYPGILRLYVISGQHYGTPVGQCSTRRTHSRETRKTTSPQSVHSLQNLILI
jgi:hypothetical protein